VISGDVFNPQIVINGDRAHASWYLVGPFTFREKNDARWIACPACKAPSYC